MTITTDHIATYRRMANPTPVKDTLGLDKLNPASWHQGLSQAHAEALPFRKLINALDERFGAGLATALGELDVDAQDKVRQIIGRHLASANMRLAISALAGAKVDFLTADPEDLQTLATIANQRAADLWFARRVGADLQIEV